MAEGTAPLLVHGFSPFPSPTIKEAGFTDGQHLAEVDTTERLHFRFSLSCIGEGNGNPLQFLPGESQGWGSLVGCHLWDRTELDTTETT